MKIAVLYICTGRYTIFFEDFFESSEKYFLPNHQKDYYVFTDGSISNSNNSRVHIIQQVNFGWPEMAVKRYHIFSQIKQELNRYDYAYFCNANLLFLDTVDDNVLPVSDGEVVVTQHPGFYNKSPNEFTYERNPKSLAYIPEGTGRHYIGSGFNGSNIRDYLKIIDVLMNNTDQDIRNGIIALWHDESHLNRYILDHPYKLLSPAYLYPEGWKLPFPKKILVRDKSLFGGHDYMRGITNKNNSKHFYFNIRQKLKTILKFIT